MTEADQNDTSIPETRAPRHSRAATVVLTLCALYCAWLASDIFRQADRVQRDFAIYYYAAAAHQRGHNPYDLQTIKRLSGGRAILPFVYPAPALHFFYPLTTLDYRTAARVYLGLKFLAIAGLLLIWRNVFLGGRGGVFFYLFCLAGFNAAIYIDLMSGNISVFEQLALWTALACLLQRRTLIFVLLIVLVSVFKLTPILFLGLPLLLRGRRALGSAVLGAAVFLAVIAASFYIPHGRQFWTSAAGSTTDEYNITAPSTHSFIRAFCGLIAALLKTKLAGPLLPNILYGAAVAGILAVSFRAVWICKKTREHQRAMIDERLLILFYCVVYALVLPRFKDYAYILLLAPTVAIVRRYGEGRALPVLAFLLLIYPANTVFRLPVLSVFFSFLLGYFPWVIAATVWVFYARMLRHDGQAGNTELGNTESRIQNSE